MNRKKKRFGRLISLVLMAMLITGAIPYFAFADDQEGAVVKEGYYENGQWTEGTLSQTLPEGIKSVNKVAERIDDNTYQISLQVVAEQRSTTVEAGASATALVIDRSGSMAACSECGAHYYSVMMSGYYYHEEGCKYCDYPYDEVKSDETRLSATQNAAKAFIEAYRANAVSGRWVNIITFSESSSGSGWYDIATESGYTNAIQAINNITAWGNTNLYAGLGVAISSLSQSQVDNEEIEKNVVVLSDGAPNRAGDDAWSMQAVVSQTTERASELKNIATVYTVCFGAANETIYAGGPVVGDFLRDSIATDSSKAFNADNTAELNIAFEDIAENITSGLDGSGLTVTDGPVEFVVATVDGKNTSDGFTWNLENPDISTHNEGNSVVTTYTYQKIYTVTLDADNPDFVEGQWYPLNGETYLTMKDGARVDFPVPAGKGIKSRYIVRWVNYDEKLLEEDKDVIHGTIPSYNSSEPTKDATEEYSFEFTGWNPEISPVTGNITYTAQYNAIKNTYTVYWVDEDGTLLEKDENVEYGNTPSYDSSEPLKEATAEYTYEFIGWSPEISPVTSDVTYTAQYNAIKNAYTVYWVDEDGTLLEKDENVEYGDMPSYDGEEPAKLNNAEFTYTFKGWNPEVGPVTQNITYIAQYDSEKNTYTVLWLNDDGSELEKDEDVEYGDMPSYDSPEPSKEATDEFTYRFLGWNPEVSIVTGNIAYTAQYEAIKNTYTVRWVDEDGSELEKDENVLYGTTPTFDSKNPSKGSTEEYSYTFEGWSPEISPVTADITYTAQYEAIRNTYTVRWVDYDGTELEKDENVEYGSMPLYDGKEPSKAASAEYTYVFTGWAPEVSAVTGDITYTAQYRESRRSYTITWINEDGTVLEVDENVPYGQMPDYNGSTPRKAATSEYTYGFNGWEPTVTRVIGNATYRASYKSTKLEEPKNNKPENPTKEDTSKNVPKTGDDNMSLVWIITLLVAGCVMLVVGIVHKKRKEE